MAFAPRALVQGAARQPLPYGLFGVVDFIEGDAAPPRWSAGIQFEALPCGLTLGVVGDPCSTDDPEEIGLPKDLDGHGLTLGEADAFMLYGHTNCSPVGMSTQRAQELAELELVTKEEAAAEGVLWNRLGDEADPVLPGVVDPLRAVAALEQYIAVTYGSLGVIHASRAAATVLARRGGVNVRGGRLTTVLGTPVVAGSGYGGIAEVTADESTIYATPALFGYRSEILYPTSREGDLLDRGRNDQYALAERSYVLGYDPCGVGSVTISLETGGGGGGGGGVLAVEAGDGIAVNNDDPTTPVISTTDNV